MEDINIKNTSETCISNTSNSKDAFHIDLQRKYKLSERLYTNFILSFSFSLSIFLFYDMQPNIVVSDISNITKFIWSIFYTPPVLCVVCIFYTISTLIISIIISEIIFILRRLVKYIVGLTYKQKN